ncbi:basic salivary proline-rich protein 2-like [Mustela nigripes]|uniref:basic salivary proline-rich protein 2-like n=1 Tax=Mustela nigripes TaxID=77151 RepID=UPI0028162933|nr:basic salivary proline-rich protein 2-like [Mustela nigripes]
MPPDPGSPVSSALGPSPTPTSRLWGPRSVAHHGRVTMNGDSPEEPRGTPTRCGNGERRKAGEEQREPPQDAWRGPGRPPGRREVSGPRPGLGPRQMSRQHQGQLPNRSPPPPTAARAGPAARSPPARARALPPARAPRRGLGGSRACRSQGASLRVPSRRGRSRSWQGAPAPARSRLPRASGPPQRQSRPPCPSRRRSPWPGQERPPVAAPCPGRTPDRPVTCAQVLGRPGQRRSHGSR